MVENDTRFLRLGLGVHLRNLGLSLCHLKLREGLFVFRLCLLCGLLLHCGLLRLWPIVFCVGIFLAVNCPDTPHHLVLPWQVGQVYDDIEERDGHIRIPDLAKKVHHRFEHGLTHGRREVHCVHLEVGLPRGDVV